MKWLHHACEELIAELREERDRLRAENASLKSQTEGLTLRIAALSEAQIKASVAPRQRLPVPEHLVGLIDWEAMGMQSPEMK